MGRLRGRPDEPAGCATLIASSRAPSWVLSWRWPAATTIESGRPLPSQTSLCCRRADAASCLTRLGFSRAPRPGVLAPFLRPVRSAAFGRLQRAGAPGPPWSPYSPATQPGRLRRSWSGWGPASNSRCRLGASGRTYCRAGLPGGVPRGQITPGRPSGQLPQDAVHHTSRGTTHSAT